MSAIMNANVVEQWVVVTNGTAFRLRESRTGRWLKEQRPSGLGACVIDVIKEFSSIEDAKDCARNNSWYPV